MPDSQAPMTQRDANRLEEAIRDLRTALVDETANLTASMRGLADKIEATYVRKDVLAPQLEIINDKLEAHSGYWTWVVRTVIGVIIVGLLALLFASGGTSGH